ncbi:DUF2865 domain-containing protein [Rhodopseudomonas faecalis]|uniref:DUF2865 domain-containing protein n=1 Tax=Rhodopseudomonas faecalis TaxID=99655 RepID=UPI003D322645
MEFSLPRRQAALPAALLLTALTVAAPPASAQNLLDMLFGGFQSPPARSSQQNFFADPFGLGASSAPPARPAVASGSGSAFCVRSCDGKYFPLSTRGGASAAQMCQAFCPASQTRVFYGSQIEYATASNGERYADSDNAFAYRKALKADCTCDGRSPAGLAPVDLALDTSLRAGDVVATGNGLVAYSGIRVGAAQTAEFTPISSYPGLNAELRARLGEMKVSPAHHDGGEAANSPAISVTPTAPVPAATSKPARRAEVR